MEWQAASGTPFYNIADVVALGLVLFCAFGGWLRGLSGELARLATILLALFLAIRLREPLGDVIGNSTRLETPVDIALAFTLIAIVVLIVLAVVRRLLKRIMQVSFTPGLERGGGAAAGGLRGLAIVATIFLLLNLWPHEYLNRTFGDSSLIGRTVRRLMPVIRHQIEHIEYEREQRGSDREEPAREVI